MTHRRIVVLSACLAMLALAACTGADQAGEDPSTTAETTSPDGAGEEDTATPLDELEDIGVVDMVVMPADSRYVTGLCSIDFFQVDETEADPLGWVIEQLEQLPTDEPAEVAEVSTMIEQLRRTQELDDPLETDDLSSVAAVLRARCS